MDTVFMGILFLLMTVVGHINSNFSYVNWLNDMVNIRNYVYFQLKLSSECKQNRVAFWYSGSESYKKL